MPSSSPPSSSAASSSHQSSLYQYYTPIPLNDSLSSTPPRVPLQPSTQHNIPRRNDRSRITIKRPLHIKDTAPSLSPVTKKAKTFAAQRELVLPQIVSPRRVVKDTIPRGLVIRGLQGQRGSLSQCSRSPFKTVVDE